MSTSATSHKKTDADQEKSNSNSLYRQWQILSRLPNGKWMGTRELQESLQREGIDISLRTIQRDLNQIAERFPIENNGATPQGWRWQSDAPIQSLPHMSSSQAVTFMMVQEHLKHLLPPSLLAEIKPWFELAQRSLATHNKTGQWVNKVRIIPATQPLIPPKVDADAQNAIYEALLQQKQLQCNYSGRSHQQAKSYVLNPLALVQRGAVIYLICTREDCEQPDEVRTFALHRFKDAKVLDKSVRQMKHFDLDNYIDAGALGFRLDSQTPSEIVELSLYLKQSDAVTFFESKLAKDQKIQFLADDMVQVSAKIPLNSQLIWWLRGFGSKIVKIEPQRVADLVWESNRNQA
ncbi:MULTISPECIES: helix-turn-helix transcriptional regulator [unclassified Acinetobacter]|uniref:helix-turn-helix transcriptional regulator n=1 Tax=unclassified Acinetobacter TaxID=196816 RepID=UPI0035B97D05